MTSQCPTTADWEVFLLDPLSPDRDRMIAHLETCPYCKVTLVELREVWSGLASPSRMSSEDTYELIPLDESPLLTEYPSMAAKGVEDSGELRSLTLATADRTMWLKAVRDKRTEDVWLYLLTEEDSLIPRNVIVRPFGMERDYLTDEQGRVNLGQMDWPAKESWRAEVKFPRAVFHLEETDDIDHPSGDATLTSSEGDRIRVSWTGDARGRRITIEVQTLHGLSSDVPLKIAVKAKGMEQPVHVRSSPVDQPVIIEHSGSLDRIDIFVYQ